MKQRYLLVALSMFIGSWLITSTGQYVLAYWRLGDVTTNTCTANMRIVYVSAMHLKAEGRLEQTDLDKLKQRLRRGFIPTEDEMYYIYNIRAASNQRPLFENQGRLICPKDPKFAIKMRMIRSPAMGFDPSYTWRPDEDTILYCPFHDLALKLDGSIVRGRGPSPRP